MNETRQWQNHSPVQAAAFRPRVTGHRLYLSWESSRINAEMGILGQQWGLVLTAGEKPGTGAGLPWWCFGADSPVLLVLWNTIISPKLKMHMRDVMGSLVIGKPAFGPRLHCWPLRDINTSPLLPQFSFPPLKNTWVRLAEESPSSVSFIFHSFLFLCKCYRLSFSSMYTHIWECSPYVRKVRLETRASESNPLPSLFPAGAW